VNTTSKSNRTTTPKNPEPFVFESGTLYADKDEYAEKSLAFEIHSITFEPNAGFEGHDRWSIRAVPSDGRGEELITLQSNEKRDEQLRTAQAYLAAHGPIKNVRLKKSGKTFYLETVHTA